MGMFDELVVEYPLPDPDHNRLTFQTKDLKCFMDHYRITPMGRLEHQEYRIEDHSDPTKEGLDKFAGMLTRIPIGWHDEGYHGWLDFYTEQAGDWINYHAKFTDGRLVEVARVFGA
jgi:hypothetical protein